MLSDQEDDDQLRCNICTECYDAGARKPKMLTCRHTFCQRCLAQYGLNKVTIPCPTCRAPTSIGKKGVAGLKDNRDLQSLVHEAQLLANSVFYSDDSDEGTSGNKKQNKNAMWCEKCLKVADPICLAVHETSYLEQGIRHLTDRLESILENTRQVLAEHASLFQAHLDNLLMTHHCCTSELTKELDQKINQYTQSIVQVQTQIDSLCLELRDRDPSSLVSIFHDAEEQTNRTREKNKPMSQQVDMINDVQNCSLTIHRPSDNQNKRDSLSMTFKIQELPKHHKIIMAYILHQIVQKKVPKVNSTIPSADSQRTDFNWQKVGGRRQKRNSLCSQSRTSSQESLTNLSSVRALSVESLPTVNRALRPKNFVQCFFDLTVNDNPLGRVVIQLRPDIAPRMVTNFVALCTGKEGYGYKGSLIFKGHPNDHIIGGDFENNDGSGGHSIYHKKQFFLADNCGLKDEIGSVRMRGMGMDESTGLGLIGSQFHIWVGKRLFRTYPRTLVIGKVIEGIEICQKISRMKMTRNMKGNHVFIDNVLISSSGRL